MEEGKDEIKCIFYSTFHEKEGLKIVQQVPENCISKEVFDKVKSYILPRAAQPELQGVVNQVEMISGKVVQITTKDWKILGCPVCIPDSCYNRNFILFNLCFAFDPSSNTSHYQVVIKKLANYLTVLELESGYLYKEEINEKLPELLKEIMEELNTLRSCKIQINSSTTIHLKVMPVRRDPPPVQDHRVPIIVSQFESLRGQRWDLATQQILPLIDGFRHVARIAAEASVDISIVKTCIQNLLYYEIVEMIPIFQYSNIYMALPEIDNFFMDTNLHEECCNCCAKQGVVPDIADIMVFLYDLKAGVTVRSLCERYPQDRNFDERTLIQWAVCNKLIRRLEAYPIHDGKSTTEQHPKLKALYPEFNGLISYDQICCRQGWCYADLESYISNDESITVIWK